MRSRGSKLPFPLPIHLAGLLCTALAVPAAADVVSVSASGEASSWHDMNSWTPKEVPNNAGDDYHVSVGAPISFDCSCTTTVLSLSVSDELSIANGVLRILDDDSEFNSVSVSGVITISGGALSIPGENASIHGSGEVVMNGGTLSAAQDGDDELTIDTSVVGRGTIGNGFSGRIVNRGFISAFGTLNLRPSLVGIDNRFGFMEAQPLSRLSLKGDVLNTGSIIKAEDGGVVELNDAQIFGGTLWSVGTGKFEAVSNPYSRLEDVTFDGGVLDVRPLARLEIDGTIQNSGVWLLNGAGTQGTRLDAPSGATLQGGGGIDASATNSNLLAGPGLLTNVDHVISGAMRVEVPLHNMADGVLLADEPWTSLNNESLALATTAKVHDGIAMAVNGGRLAVTTTVTGNGSWRAAGGTILGNRATIDTCGPLTVEDGGHLDLQATLFLASTIRFGPGTSLRAFRGPGFQAPVPRLTSMGGLVLELVDEADWDVEQFPQTEFRFGGGPIAPCTNGNPAGFSAVEVGGTDAGNVTTHFKDNFEIPHLIVAPGADVVLVDVVDNGNRGGPVGEPEALYVDKLQFDDSAGRIYTNGLHLYYKTLISGSPTQILPEPEMGTQLLVGAGLLAWLARRPRLRRH